jgi:hypothetical protein
MRSSAIGLATKSLAAMIAESQMLVLTLMTYLGQSPVAWPINRRSRRPVGADRRSVPLPALRRQT